MTAYQSYFLTLLSFTLLLCSHTTVAKIPWSVAKPKDFPTVERFFGNAGCTFSFPQTFLYDTQSSHWLSHQEATKQLPEMAELFSSQNCEVSLSANQLAHTLNLSWPEQPGLVVMFFEPPTGMLDVFFKEGSSSRKRYDQQLEFLEQLTDIPRYRILTPMTGLKSQF